MEQRVGTAVSLGDYPHVRFRPSLMRPKVELAPFGAKGQSMEEAMMVVLKVAVDAANYRSEPSTEGGEATVIAPLPRGATVSQLGYVEHRPDWVRAKAQDLDEGFIKRSLLAQVGPGPLAGIDQKLLAVYDRAIREATDQYDKVGYELGGKRPSEGKVDCSGWIAFINRLGFNAVNAAANARIFSKQALTKLNTHSDHQVAMVGYLAGQLFSLDDVGSLDWRPGLLVGVNFGDYNWERGQRRVFGIDHIVQTMSDSAGSLFVTQSSSSGRGVNALPLSDWLHFKKPHSKRPSVSELASANRVHVADIFALANFTAPMEATGDIDLPELDVSLAAPG